MIPSRPGSRTLSELSRWGDEVEDKLENNVFCSPWRALTTSAHDRITWLTPASSQPTFPAPRCGDALTVCTSMARIMATLSSPSIS